MRVFGCADDRKREESERESERERMCAAVAFKDSNKSIFKQLNRSVQGQGLE